MDADERLTALKKAYADIILNTAKEAAARIMVSERKAVRFEYELKNAKDDSLQMLMRLKQMMDSKINEAEVTSSVQQKKIEELEAQLQEAEDIVKDLREELGAVEAEVERILQNKQVKHTVQVNNASTPEPVTFSHSEIQPNSNIDHTNKRQQLFNSLFPLNKSLISNGDLPSIILRSKETELYRNGCTQRIRACERAPQDKKLPFCPESISKEDEVIEKEIVLEHVKDMDLAANNSCLTSPNSVKLTAVEENSDESKVTAKELERMSESQSTSKEECMTIGQVKDEVDQLPLMGSESKVEVKSQPLTDRVIKYTFQRKRKRGVLVNESGSSEENQTGDVGPAKVMLVGESTPEKIGLEQVAHQLISLSDKKWW